MTRTLIVQLQQERLSDDLLNFAIHQLKQLESDLELSKAVKFVYGEKDGNYVNIEFESFDLRRLWDAIKKKLLHDDVVGGLLKKGAIVVCQGNSCWSDYLMLYHYDDLTEVDEI